jgi:hypothetical protein
VIAIIKGISAVIFADSQSKIENCLESERLRLRDTAFTRSRKLTAKIMLYLILHRIYTSLQLDLDDFYEGTGCAHVSKQAFSKARQQLSPVFVRSFFDFTAETAAKDNTMPNYRGMCLIAIDGSDIALENSAELKETFGCSGSKKDAATALCSIAYGPLDHIIYDCQINSYKKDERDLARLHVKRLDELGLKKSLLLFDRWYPSAEFISFLLEKGFHFVMRARSKWSLDVDNVKTQGTITLEHEGRSFSVRVLKIKLPTGETETLLTSLNQKQLPIRNAAELYFRRWAVETSYDMLKSKLQLENFSGKTAVSVKQDFYATMYLANLAACIAAEADEKIAEADEGKRLKYPRRSSSNRTIHFLRKAFILILLEPDSKIRDAMLRRIFDSIAEKPVSIVPNRSPARCIPRKKRFYIAKKSVL